MILLASAEALIRCPVAQLYAYVTNMENYQQWFPGVISIVESNDLPHGHVGKQYRESLALPAGETQLTIEVKRAEVNGNFVTEGSLEPLLPMMTMGFRDTSKKSCYFSLMYHSRNLELEAESPLVKALQQDLGDRITVAIDTLTGIVTDTLMDSC